MDKATSTGIGPVDKIKNLIAGTDPYDCVVPTFRIRELLAMESMVRRALERSDTARSGLVTVIDDLTGKIDDAAAHCNWITNQPHEDGGRDDIADTIIDLLGRKNTK